MGIFGYTGAVNTAGILVIKNLLDGNEKEGMHDEAIL